MSMYCCFLATSGLDVLSNRCFFTFDFSTINALGLKVDVLEVDVLKVDVLGVVQMGRPEINQCTQC